MYLSVDIKIVSMSKWLDVLEEAPCLRGQCAWVHLCVSRGSNVQQDEELLFLTIFYVVLAMKYIKVQLDLFFIQLLQSIHP